jgi:hypothetical protein
MSWHKVWKDDPVFLHSIYFLVNPFEKEIYVSHTRRDLEIRFKEHVRGSDEFTRDFIKRLKDQKTLPKLILAEQVRVTDRGINAYKLIWIRIAMENGFTPMNPPNAIINSQNLFDYYIPKYIEREKIDFIELCNNQEIEIQADEYAKYFTEK